MKQSDRRFARRFNLIVPLRFRKWGSVGPDRAAASVNVSESGVYFETEAPPGEGAWVQLKIDMPLEITGNPCAEWCCTGKVVRVQPVRAEGAPPGVAVRFSYYEVAKSASQKLMFAGGGDLMVRDTPSRHALIVDAEPGISAALKDVLRPAGIDAITVARAADAENHLRVEKFDVVFVDLGLSAVNGIELTRKTRSLGLNRMTPIILISGDHRRGVFAQGFNAGASFIVQKPIDKPHLIKLLRVAQGSMERERRRFRRIALGVKVRLTFENSQLNGETVDLSLNGAMVRASRTFPVGSAFHVDLYLPSAIKPISGMGVVMRVIDGHQMGIQMDGFSLDDSGRLQDYLLPQLIAEPADLVHK